MISLIVFLCWTFWLNANFLYHQWTLLNVFLNTYFGLFNSLYKCVFWVMLQCFDIYVLMTQKGFKIYSKARIHPANILTTEYTLCNDKKSQ